MTDDRAKLDAELQEIAEDYVLHWLGEPDSNAVRSLHQHLRDTQAKGMRMAAETVHKLSKMPSAYEDAIRTLAAALEAGEAPDGGSEDDG